MIPQAISRKEDVSCRQWLALGMQQWRESWNTAIMSIYMVVIRPVSLDCTIYMLEVFAMEVSRSNRRMHMFII